MKLVYFLLILNICGPYGLEARDTKDLKRAHTYNLRRWIQLLEFSQTDPVGTALSKVRLLERSRIFNDIKPRLSKGKQQQFGQAYEQFLEAEARGEGSHKEFLRLRQLTFSLYKVVSLPAQVPDLALGKSLYRSSCEACHGNVGHGDGVLTKNKLRPMDPRPLPFGDLIKKSLRSPYSFFNTSMIGSRGTAMPAFAKSFKAHDLWSLAFYLSSEWLHTTPPPVDGKVQKHVTLKDLATMTNSEILEHFGGNSSTVNHTRNHLPFGAATERR